MEHGGKKHIQYHSINFSYLVSVASLQWDSFEQFCVWQLLSAEGSDPTHIIPILANLNAQGGHG